MINRISFYGYLFDKQVEHIMRYEILFKSEDKFLVKHTCIDTNFKNPTAEISVTLCHSLSDSISTVVKNFRDQEIQNGVYKELEPGETLPDVYAPLIDELRQACEIKGVISFTFFGHMCKYKPRTAAKTFLSSMGYLVPTTKKPHVYVLDDFIRHELQLKKASVNDGR
jgi:hypothetical protein